MIILAVTVLSLLPLWAEPVSPLQKVFDDAVTALSKAEYPAAEAGFQRVLKAQPKHIGALGNLGVVYARTDRFAEAAQVYRRALALAPEDPGLLLNLGLAFLKQERYADALTPLSKLVDQEPGHKQANELLATAQLYAGEPQMAVSRLASLDPSPGVLFLLGVGYLKLDQRQLAARMFEQLAFSLPADQVAFLRGKAYYDSGNFDEAENELSRLAGASPEVRRELAKVYISQRRGDDAERELTAVLREKPGDREATYYLGALLVEQGQPVKGEPMLRKVTTGSWGANYYLGKSALKQKRVAAALQYLTTADRLQPNEPNVLFQLFRAQQAAGQKIAASKTAAKLKSAREKQREDEQAALVLR